MRLPGLSAMRVKFRERNPKKSATIDTNGKMESCVIEGDELRIDGWAVSESGAVDALKVACAGKDLRIRDARWGLPSPDVRAAHPFLEQADRCRFQVRARLDPANIASARHSAITCTPFVGGREGRILVHLIEPAIPLPSQDDIDSIGGGFIGVSAEFLGHFIQLGGLKPDDHVLDVGCGVGRMAYMLAHYLGPDARYEGFDIVANLIRWTQESITPRVPHFQFQHANIYNKLYNPAGVYRGSEYPFPFPDESFDFVFLTSVFTHMMPPDVRHYLDEFHRVLRPGGRCLTTCFLLNRESHGLISRDLSTIKLVRPLGQCFATDHDVPEIAIGYDEKLLLRWVDERGFKLLGKHYGSWCGRTRYKSYQDILVYQK